MTRLTLSFLYFVERDTIRSVQGGSSVASLVVVVVIDSAAANNCVDKRRGPGGGFGGAFRLSFNHDRALDSNGDVFDEMIAASSRGNDARAGGR
mmetsp:Transcript_20541/g.44085  ORF Transcript_20541/g.44085 Transcript_20541/m.44085 type:complete len:94 (-) Transcript_20541:72-353(-)